MRSGGGLPGLYTELDSIVVNQLDYAYFNSRWVSSSIEFSDEAMEMLTDDTLLFHRDTVYPYDEGLPIADTFLRTKFRPKGWFAFHDAQNILSCRYYQTVQDREWLIRNTTEPDLETWCVLKAQASPSSIQMWTMYYPDKGFVFNGATAVAGFDVGKARIYYWR